VLVAAGVPIRFRRGSLPPDTGIGDETRRRERYAEGCAIYVGAYPAFPGGRTVVVVELWQYVGAYPAFPGGRTVVVVELWQR
jgi:hypothetical protein